MPHYVLNFSAPSEGGQVYGLTRFLHEQGGYVEQFSVFDDQDSRRFYARAVFLPGSKPLDLAQLRHDYAAFLHEFDAEGGLWHLHEKVPVLLMVSKTDHCLRTLLNAARWGDLNMNVVAVASNHDLLRGMVEEQGIPYHHLPVGKENRAEQEEEIIRLFEASGAEFIVLARYMQILSNAASIRLAGRAINIHHSFLPGFKGANPYKQAHERGVKLIGATAHYVTSDLDEGPIIEQAVERVDHAFTPEQLLSTGRHIEALVLERALRFVLERRVFINGERTVILR